MIGEFLQNHYESFINCLKDNIVNQADSEAFKKFIYSLDVKLYIYPQEFSENHMDSDVDTNGKGIILSKQMSACIALKNKVDSYNVQSSKYFFCKIKALRDTSDDLYVSQKKIATMNDQDVYSYNLIWSIDKEGAFKDIGKKYIAKTILEFIKRQVKYIESMNTEMEGFKLDDIDFLSLYFEVLKKEFNLPEYEQLCRLSRLSYENRKNKGIMCFVRDKKLYSNAVLFENVSSDKVDFAKKENLQYVRKLLEMSNTNYEGDVRKCLLFDDLNRCRGIAKECDIKDNNLLIYFDGIDRWKLSYNNETILRYDGGQLYLNEQQKKETDINDLNISDEYKEIYGKILECLSKQEHGALMIIAQDSEKEIDRLCGMYERGTKIELKITEDNLCFLSGFCSVDGAIFMDCSGNCYGYGVILDGTAKIKGMPECGARHNSAANYIAGKDRYAVVVSEDKDKGMKIIRPNDYEVIDG